MKHCLAIASLCTAMTLAGCGDGSDSADAASGGARPTAPGTSGGVGGGSTGGSGSSGPVNGGVTAESLYPIFDRYAKDCDTLEPLAAKLAKGQSLSAQESASYNQARSDLYKVYEEINAVKKKTPRAKPKIVEAFNAKARKAAESYAAAGQKLEKALASGKAGSWEKDQSLDSPAVKQKLLFIELDATGAFGITVR